MSIEDIQDIFEKHESEFGKFESVQQKKSNHRDLHAFLILEPFVPERRRIIAGAEHDKIWLNVDIEEFEESATEEMIIDLIRCGVNFSDGEGFWMFC